MIFRGELLPRERISYTNAVLCLQKLPNQVPTAEYPGVRSRFDDFVATHINYTLHTHYSGLFLPWHRRFIWLWERALREECGYQGYLPYWDWPLWADNLAASPLFDGSETSLSGDGEYNPGEQNMTGGNVTLLRGSGGGCAKSGPFKNMKVHMGPFSRTLTSTTEIPAPRFDYNPRCLNRSLNDFVASRYTNSTLVSTLMATTKMADFQMALDHWPPREDGVLGPHGGGHFSIGSTMQDLFGSPQDPAFYLHHSQIDRLWAKWQDADDANRRNALNGTSTIMNPPAADPVTLDTMMEFGYLDAPRPVHEVMSPLANGFFYIYAGDT
ncbi:N-acetyl-6-hydroxytryptophan oxidase ivoB [Penicillium cinerascens]|uniref:N-acetyl-6-hydroxytryptophan oxidase ivoB n=1 Tax=Penicillium cinerascens TaxID=70096 RepID=A0A9W9N1S5_9EURO|nr:N-acetyl-6-hydroxytryptophan oxidase ivoB [Penicillium cinerascens]KAJ5211586.1 N-acetyl-6-hydroxytryptophan oxidase ivoB [Penicillium cinerascens]